MNPQEASTNQETLNKIENQGGVYVWDSEVFTVAFIDTPIQNEAAALLTRLTGVQQIAIDSSQLTFSVLKMVARIPGLESLAILRSMLDASQVEELQLSVPELVLVDK
ncbi:hypothetical protein SAMN04515617_13521 [Collimonas sp. OK242]|jgi:hypothetical protein|uniref:hypothetical protein n=1 Tax=Collimonas sp. OK242 TaxID=1798195 RepID=UPI00089B32E7|nr:hypothetical protein [Collimonas sp. OK242]SDY95453.1 hypothetical protein SAMN04515617_13521 [Collimonas sp. OK242]